MGVYILQFSERIGSDKHSCEFYVGFVDDSARPPQEALQERMKAHRAGSGAALTRWANSKGIGYEVILFMPYKSKTDERRIKNQKNTRLYLERHFKKEQQKS